MKKATIIISIIVFILSGCHKDSNLLEEVSFITFIGTIDEIYNNSSLLVRTEDKSVGFDLASVHYDRDLATDYIFQIGDQVKLTILPEIRESYPVQVTAIDVELLE